MKTQHIILLIVCTLAMFACESSLIRREFTDVDRQMIPYKVGQTVSFVDYLGNKSVLSVMSDLTEWYQFEQDLEFQLREIQLLHQGNNMGLWADTWFFDHTYCDKNGKCEIKHYSFVVWLPGKSFELFYDPNDGHLISIDSLLVHDSVSINNKVYYNVVESPVDSFLYNKTYGILQFKGQDKKVYKINPEMN